MSNRKLNDFEISAMLAPHYIAPPDGDADSDLDDPGHGDEEFDVNAGEDTHM